MSSSAKNMVNTIYPLHLNLASGLQCHVRDKYDLAIVNEIFVNACYAEPLDIVLRGLRTNTFLDLGCNIGCFSLYLINRLLQCPAGGYNFNIIAVDGSNQTLTRAKKNFIEQDRVKLETRVTFKHGLIGLRKGSANFYQHPFHGCSKVVNRPKAVRVPYIDIEKIAPAYTDLIKIDTEGAEGLFVQQYETLLKKTKYFLAELHYVDCDVPLLESNMLRYGFSEIYRKNSATLATSLWKNNVV